MASRAAARRAMPAIAPGLPTDEAYFQRLPDILKAQLHVALDSARRKAMQQGTPAISEQLLWAAAPFIRTRTLMALFAVW